MMKLFKNTYLHLIKLQCLTGGCRMSEGVRKTGQKGNKVETRMRGRNTTHQGWMVFLLSLEKLFLKTLRLEKFIV